MGPYFKGCARSGARRPLCECGLFGDSGERQTPPVAVGCCGGPPPAPSPHVTRATSAPAAHMPRIHTHVGRVSWGRGGRGCAHACARPQRLGATPRPLTRPVGCRGGKLLGTTGGVLLAGTAWFIFQCIGAHNNWHHLCLLDVSVCT